MSTTNPAPGSPIAPQLVPSVPGFGPRPQHPAPTHKNLTNPPPAPPPPPDPTKAPPL